MMAMVMRAVRVHKFGSPSVLQIDNGIPVPSLGDKQVLIKVKSSGVNPVDTYIREGAFATLPDLPYIPGKDGAGIVHEVGKLVDKFKPGQRVFFCNKKQGQFGSLGEYAVANQEYVFPLSDKLTFHQGAAIPVPYFTAYRALMVKAFARENETVLVHGASGAVGLAAVQMARFYNMNVLGTAGTPEGLKLVSENGAHHVFCHKEKNYIEKIMEATEGKGVNIILEMLANVNLSKDLKILAQRGRIMIIGCRGNVTISPRDMMGPETSMCGVALLNTTEDEWKDISSAVVNGIEENWVKPVIDKIYPLEKVANAHYDIVHSKGAKGKLVISVEE